MPQVKKTHRITATFEKPKISAGELKDLLHGIDDEARLSFETLMGHDQRDPYPTRLRVVIDLESEQ